MDYTELAEELLSIMMRSVKMPVHKKVGDIAKGEMFILNYLAENDGAVPSEISKLAHVSTARITATINALEEKGLISREFSENDRRMVLLHITEAGRISAKKKYQSALAYSRSLLQELGEEDAREYVRLIKKIVRISERIKEE